MCNAARKTCMYRMRLVSPLWRYRCPRAPYTGSNVVLHLLHYVCSHVELKSKPYHRVWQSMKDGFHFEGNITPQCNAEVYR
jgi:hypothetical protein